MNYIEQSSPRAKMKALCIEAAAPNAASVDKDSRFPVETLAALKRERLMGLLVPAELGGKGASLTEVADLCCVLAQSCASSGMIYANAQHQAAQPRCRRRRQCVASRFHEARRRRAARCSPPRRPRPASAAICATASAVPSRRQDGEFSLVKDATVISCARQADAIFFATASPQSPRPLRAIRVMVALHQASSTELKPTTAWGGTRLRMRGTCMRGFRIPRRARRRKRRFLLQPFAELAAQSMLATSQHSLPLVWYGIAQDAVGRAQAMVRGEARKKPDVKPASALPLAEAGTSVLQALRSSIKDALDRFGARQGRCRSCSARSASPPQ